MRKPDASDKKAKKEVPKSPPGTVPVYADWKKGPVYNKSVAEIRSPSPKRRVKTWGLQPFYKPIARLKETPYARAEPQKKEELLKAMPYAKDLKARKPIKVTPKKKGSK